MASLAAGTVLGAVCVAVVAPRATAIQQTVRVSVDSSGAEGNSSSEKPGLSSDGRIVVFSSVATNLVAGDANGLMDIFAHDRSSGVTERLNVDPWGNEANGSSWLDGGQLISADGSRVVFTSGASNLDPNDTNNVNDVFVRDRASGTTTRVSVDSAGNAANYSSMYGAISADGRLVAFQSYADDLVPGDHNGTLDVFVRDLAAGTTELVSVDSNGVQGNGASYWPAISSDGRFVAFSSAATNLVAGDTNGILDVFVHDRQAGTTERVSVDSAGNESNDHCALPSISDDGNFVAFETGASNLVAGDANQSKDVFVRDRTSGTTVRASVDSAGAEGTGDSYGAAMDPGGRCVAFISRATTLVVGDTNVYADAFVHDVVTGATERVSVDSNDDEADCFSAVNAVRGNGRVVAFSSCADDLVASDTNGQFDIFVHDMCSTPASWTNYGAGFPGTHGVPSFTSQQFPAFGATITADLANSYGQPTIGFLVLGLQRARLPTKWGGDLLVLPTLIAPITFSYSADSFTGTIPDDVDLCGVTIDLQGIEADPGAQFGVSFSQGLEFTIGN